MIIYIVFIIMGIATIVYGAYLICNNINFSLGIFIIILSIILIISAIIGSCTTHIPTKQDVLNGKAIYQETIQITNSDTIKIYEIVWKNDRN